MNTGKGRKSMALTNRKMDSILLTLARDHNIQPGTTAIWLGRLPPTVFDKLTDPELVDIIKTLEEVYNAGLKTGSRINWSADI